MVWPPWKAPLLAQFAAIALSLLMRKNKGAGGEVDIAEATKIAPQVAAIFGSRGLGPYHE